ncbi:alpha/beta fold hydrolase [Micromonospora eburnea]|uniref:Pimeloyl-ACP methyl ester carboxylesterase n=1 Tax=Micromonospora eburnea TaxID=227316 RepID=A0A1C6UAX3_9ACTN|nr:alpha/beta hydrolase [Micromonospora eburnea]SCL51182.1 Pimeloyl-ACP methyl ester carboxylesterase [Micromonospora eburnea]
MIQTDMIRTDGASLYCERRGNGPALLMISGGGGDAGYYSQVAEALADDYTVLTYDRRGNSRSTVDDRSAPLRMAEQSADALAVLAHHQLTSALVFGGSGGALIGLDLAARHRDVVEGLIAHEPPVFSLLSAGDRALIDELDEITRREGPWPSYLRFMTTIDRADSPAVVHNRVGRRLLGGAMRVGQRLAAYGPRPLREVSRFMGNAEYLMTREFAPFVAFEPDYDALTVSEIPIVIGVGVESRAYYPGRGGDAVAARLGLPVVEFPGAHAGYTQHPAAFATTLRAVLSQLCQPTPQFGE